VRFLKSFIGGALQNHALAADADAATAASATRWYGLSRDMGMSMEPRELPAKQQKKQKQPRNSAPGEAPPQSQETWTQAETAARLTRFLSSSDMRFEINLNNVGGEQHVLLILRNAAGSIFVPNVPDFALHDVPFDAKNVERIVVIRFISAWDSGRLGRAPPDALRIQSDGTLRIRMHSTPPSRQARDNDYEMVMGRVPCLMGYDVILGNNYDDDDADDDNDAGAQLRLAFHLLPPQANADSTGFITKDFVEAVLRLPVVKERREPGAAGYGVGGEYGEHPMEFEMPPESDAPPRFSGAGLRVDTNSPDFNINEWKTIESFEDDDTGDELDWKAVHAEMKAQGLL
jgi:hypothetical protein